MYSILIDSVRVLVGPFNRRKAQVGAFSRIGTMQFRKVLLTALNTAQMRRHDRGGGGVLEHGGRAAGGRLAAARGAAPAAGHPRHRDRGQVDR